jgi:hypothetical protein
MTLDEAIANCHHECVDCGVQTMPGEVELGRVLINAQKSGFGGEAEILCSTRALPVLTPSRHKRPISM